MAPRLAFETSSDDLPSRRRGITLKITLFTGIQLRRLVRANLRTPPRTFRVCVRVSGTSKSTPRSGVFGRLDHTIWAALPDIIAIRLIVSAEPIPWCEALGSTSQDDTCG